MSSGSGQRRSSHRRVVPSHQGLYYVSSSSTSGRLPHPSLPVAFFQTLRPPLHTPDAPPSWIMGTGNILHNPISLR